MRDYHCLGFENFQNRVPASIIDSMISEVSRLLYYVELHPTDWRVCWLLEGNDKKLERIDPITSLSNEISDFLSSPILIEIAEKLIGEPVSLFRDKLIFKAPKQGGYRPHQDYGWWTQFKPSELVTLVIPLSKADQQSGSLGFFEGSHKHGLLGASGKTIDIDECDATETAQFPALCPQDIMAFHSLTVHFSEHNTSKAQRTLLYATYVAKSSGFCYDKFIEEVSDSRNALGFNVFTQMI